MAMSICISHKLFDAANNRVYVGCMDKPNGTPWGMKDGKRLRAFRQGRKWSQIQLAIELGCDQSLVSRIEGGYPPPRAVRRLIEILTREVSA